MFRLNMVYFAYFIQKICFENVRERILKKYIFKQALYILLFDFLPRGATTQHPPEAPRLHSSNA